MLSNNQINEYIKRLLISRMRILSSHGFFGLLLMHMKFSIDETVETACTDGNKIIFGSDFLNSLNENELDFVMMHELLHIILKHCYRENDFDHQIFNIACDIVVNSNILYESNMDLNSITLHKYGPLMHITPNKKEGYLYSAEEVYMMLLNEMKKNKSSNINSNSQTNKNNNSNQNSNGQNYNSNFDDHSRWGNTNTNDEEKEIWKKRILDAAKAIEIRNANNGRDDMPLLANRVLKDLKNSQIDWRSILNNFIQEETNDYSFYPPDHRYDDSPFYLPDFNETDEKVSNILFMIDTSGSMSDEMIAYAYSEIKGAIEQFNGKLEGKLGFFDADLVPPIPFDNVDQLLKIKPKGGGGTDFEVVFDYLKKQMIDNMPASIIILTDGYAPFPKEEKALGVPVLWLINNEEITPPWGKIARITI